MSTHEEPFDYSTHWNKDVTHTLEVVATPEVPNNRSLLTISIIRKNSGKKIEASKSDYIECTLNGSVIYTNNLFGFKELSLNGTDKTIVTACYINHNSSGNATFDISVKLKCDELVDLGDWTFGAVDELYGTHTSAAIHGQCTRIDQSLPTVNGLSAIADRYGVNASVSFMTSHKEYELTSIQFILSGLTSYQAHNRNGNSTADSSTVKRNSDDTYDLILTKTKNLTNSIAVFLNLDDSKNGEYPLDSGGSYDYEITATAFNGKQVKLKGTIHVPQKVTGITCETSFNINPGQSMNVDYSVEPPNAEYPDVTFTSSNTQIATVDNNGIVKGIAQGPCTITVKTKDGGYTATCLIYVLDSSVYPILEPLERYFKASHMNRMILATQFIKFEIEEMSGDVSDFEIINLVERTERILNIFPILQSVYANCGRLKTAAELIDITVEGLPEIRNITKINAGWQIILNEWILFLNMLHEKINGG